MTLDGAMSSQLSLAHRREPQVVYLVEADLRADPPGKGLRWGWSTKLTKILFLCRLRPTQEAIRPARCPDDFGSLPGLIRLPGSLILGRMSGIDLPVVGFLRAAQHKG